MQSPHPTGNGLAAGLALLLTAACASYTPAPIDPARLPIEYAQRHLDDPALRAFVSAFAGSDRADWPPPTLDLESLQAIALWRRPELRTARARLAQAAAAAGLAGELPNPRLGIGPGLVANPGGQTPWLLTAALAIPLQLAGQRDARVEAAAGAVAAARIAVLQADQAVRADVARRAFAAAVAQQQHELARQLLQLRRQAEAQAQQRATAGAADAIEVAAATTAVCRAELALAASRSGAEVARTELAAALGMPTAALARLPLQLPASELPVLADAAAAQLADTAVRQRLDVTAALCSYVGAEAQLRLQVARQWPEFEIGPGYEYDQGLHKYRLDVGITLPLLHGNGAAIEQAAADRAAAAADFEAVQTAAIADTALALQQFAQQRRQLAAAQQLADAAAATVAMARQQAALGAGDRGIVIAARIDEVEARAQLSQQQQRAREAWLQLELALQQPVGPGLLAWQHATPAEQP